jgi:hypothetical protein
MTMPRQAERTVPSADMDNFRARSTPQFYGRAAHLTSGYNMSDIRRDLNERQGCHLNSA